MRFGHANHRCELPAGRHLQGRVRRWHHQGSGALVLIH